MSTQTPTTTAHLWRRYGARAEQKGDARLPPGEVLAALRRGAGREAGTVPAMWPHYSVPDDETRAPGRSLIAEHETLVLFGFHQQSAQRLVHTDKQAFADCLRLLRGSERFRDRTEALDARVAAAATASSISELAWHLRGLIALIKDADLVFNYTKLFRDLRSWQSTAGRDEVRRRWGRGYYAWGTKEQAVKASPTSSDSSATEETTDD